MTLKLILTFVFIFILQSCGDGSWDASSSSSSSEKKVYAGGVKLIASNIDDPRDPSTMQQNTYQLGPERRLLTRIEGMSERSERAVVNGVERMYLVVSSDAFVDERAIYETAIEICPITANWMMLATWDRAHPFPTSRGEWQSRGGDFSRTDCVTADTSYEDPREDALYFDVSDWYIFYVRSRNRNYGLMVKSDREVTVYGDEDSLRAPHFVWRE